MSDLETLIVDLDGLKLEPISDFSMGTIYTCYFCSCPGQIGYTSSVIIGTLKDNGNSVRSLIAHSGCLYAMPEEILTKGFCRGCSQDLYGKKELNLLSIGFESLSLCLHLIVCNQRCVEDLKALVKQSRHYFREVGPNLLKWEAV